LGLADHLNREEEKPRKLIFLAIACVIAVVFGATYFSIGGSTSEASPNGPHVERSVVVDRVIDGDTIVLEGGEHVRLVGVDTEESELNSYAIEKHPELRGMTEEEYEQTPYYERGMAAKSLTKDLCQANEVWLDVDNFEPQDSHDRTLAVVYVKVDGSWVNINAELLRSGYADVLFIPPSEFNPYKWR